MEIKFIDVIYKNILRNVNFNFKSNTISSVIGLGASGKSTIVSLISGNIKPTSGKIELSKSIGIVEQNPEEQLINLTVEDEIAFYLDAHNCHKDDREKHIKDTLRMVGLDTSYLKRNPFTLSIGEMKLITIGCVLAFNPKIIVFDEPTTGLDNNACDSLIKIIRLLKNRYHKTIIIISKDVDFVHKISDNIYVIDGGKVVKTGTKYDVFTDFSFLKKYQIGIPKVVAFSKYVLDNKKIKLGYRDEINDLLKDIYRYK